MGCSHSTPVPTEHDLRGAKHPRSSALLHNSVSVAPGGGGDGNTPLLDFVLPKNGFNKPCSVTGGILSHSDSPLRLKPVATAKGKEHKGSGTTVTRSVLFRDEDEAVVALLVMDNLKSEMVQILSLSPHSVGQSAALQFQGHAFYEWAIVKRRPESLQYVMEALGVRYHTDYVGQALLARPKLVLKRQGVVCLSFFETVTVDDRVQWECQMAPGMDPVLMICFVAAFDKVQESQKNKERKLMEVAMASGG